MYRRLEKSHQTYLNTIYLDHTGIHLHLQQTRTICTSRHFKINNKNPKNFIFISYAFTQFCYCVTLQINHLVFQADKLQLQFITNYKQQNHAYKYLLTQFIAIDFETCTSCGQQTTVTFF